MASSQRTAASWLLLVGTTLAGLVAAMPAFGFCQATTCNKANCTTDSRECVTEGASLAWVGNCLTLNLQGDAAPGAGIEYEDAKASLERAAEAWMSAECPGGGHPSLTIKVEGAVTCNIAEYNSKKHNANVVMFREGVWPYTGQSADTLGFTNLNFDPDSGALYDADIEINATEAYAVGRLPKANEADLDSVLTHEVGHLLGLGHTLDVSATMVGGYQNGTYELRTLGDDDIEGICALYPPQRKVASSSCEPRHGFSELCGDEQPADTTPGGGGSDDEDVGNNSGSKGCSVSQAPSTGASGAAWLCVILAAGVAARRKRRHALARSRRTLVRVVAGGAIALGCSRLTAPDWSLIPAEVPNQPEGGEASGGAPPTQPDGGQAGALAGGEGGVGGVGGAGGEGGEATSGTSGSGGSGGKGGAGGGGGKGGTGGTAGTAGTGGSAGSGGGGGTGGGEDPLTPTPCTGSPGPITDAVVLFAGPAKPTGARGGRAGLDADCETERVKLNLPQTKTHAFISVSETDFLGNWGVPDWVPEADVPSRQFADLPVLRRVVGPTGIAIASSWQELITGRAINSLICGAVLPSNGFWWLSGNDRVGKLPLDTTKAAVLGQFAGDLQTCSGWTMGQHDAANAARPGSAQYAGARLLAAAEAATATFFFVPCDVTDSRPILCLAYTP